MTTKGFTEGARRVAVDENIALLRLRPFDRAADEGTFVRSIELTLDFYVPQHADFDIELAPDHDLPSGQTFRIQLGVDEYLRNPDGSAAEILEDVLRAHAAPM